MRHVYVFLALFALSATTHAQTRYEWVGGASGDWTEPTNWSPAGVPAAADTAVVGGASGTVATLTAATTVAGLELVGFAAVGGDADLTVTDRLLWSSDSFDAFRGVGTVTVAAGATLRMATPSRLHIGGDRVVVNDGAAVWETPASWDAGRFVNHGTLDLAFDGPPDFLFAFVPGTEAFTNHATGVIRRTGSGDARYGATLVNDGLIRIENGSFDLSSSTVGTGTIEVEPGATLRAANGTHSQAGITGSAVEVRVGQLIVTDTYTTDTTTMTGGLLTLDADATITDFVMSGGGLNGSGDLTVTGSLDWTDGQMAGSGTTTLGPAIPFAIGEGSRISLGGTRTFRTEGAVTWTGDADLSGASEAVFETAGTLTSSGPGERESFFIGFRNTGTLVHDGGTLRFTDSPLANEGVVRIESGVLSQKSTGTDTGRYEIAETGRLEFFEASKTLTEDAEVVGTGTVAFTRSSVVNRAAWRPGTSPGVLTVDSDWPAMQPEGVLAMEVGGTVPGTDHDQLAVAGTAELGGTLRITLTDGFEPANGDRFLIIPASAVSGNFDALDLPTGLDAFIDATDDGAELVIGMPTSGEDDTASAPPTAFALERAHPNPFAERATLRYAVAEAGRVTLAVFDVLGREVAVLLDEDRAAGRYEAALDGRDLPSGVYVVRMTTGRFAQTQRVTLLR